MADRRYRTAKWQRLRKAVLARDGHVCQIQGPRCTVYATTVDHVLPSSTHPHLFWDPSNLRAACRRCNFGAGAALAAANTRQTIEHLRAVVEQLRYENDGLRERLAAYESAPAKLPAPAIR
jgi:5-methylcytosine-specific restriction endonuclease McrA